MEYLNEAVALGIDCLILGLCLREYYSYKRTVTALKSATQVSLDSQLKNYVAEQKDKKIHYAIIRGHVIPIGSPIRSVMVPTVTGVLQAMKLSEHKVARGFAGFWVEQRKVIHESFNEVPFKISNADIGVEIIGGLGSDILDMDVVYDNYEPSSLSFFDHIFGFFSGVRQRGIQTTEEILREGSFITAIGEIELEGNNLRLQASNSGPMFLTTSTKNVLIKKFEDAKSSMVFKIFIFSSISIGLLTIIGRRFYLKKRQEKIERNIKETLEKKRQERRANERQKNLPEDQCCVICVTNPKEIIVLPCGHVCLCEDCSKKILLSCPICRTKIQTKAAAFIT